MELTDFLLARIAEDAAAAKAAIEAPGRGGVGGWYWSNAGEAVFLDGTATYVVAGDEQSRPAGRHIVRWDPERVMAELEVKRRIIESQRRGFVLDAEIVSAEEGGEGGQLTVTFADGTNRTASESELFAEFGRPSPLSPVLLLLALPFADHPDYRPEWRP